MYSMIALFPGLCIGGHKPGNEANHEKVTSTYVLVCVCVCLGCVYVCVCVTGEGEVFHITHSLASHTLHRKRKGLVTLQPSSSLKKRLVQIL